jgi:hypothetical protein
VESFIYFSMSDSTGTAFDGIALDDPYFGIVGDHPFT